MEGVRSIWDELKLFMRNTGTGIIKVLLSVLTNTLNRIKNAKFSVKYNIYIFSEVQATRFGIIH